MRRFLLRLLTLVRFNRAEQDLAREIATHLQLLEDDLQRRGMTAVEAHRAARIALGGIEPALPWPAGAHHHRYPARLRRALELTLQFVQHRGEGGGWS